LGGGANPPSPPANSAYGNPDHVIRVKIRVDLGLQLGGSTTVLRTRLC